MFTMIVALAFAEDPACAARGGRGGPQGPPPGPPPAPPYELLIEHADELGLDAATLAAIQRKVAAAKPELDALRAEVEAAEEARRELHREGRALMDEVMALLSEEQREAAREVLPPPPPMAPR